MCMLVCLHRGSVDAVSKCEGLCELVSNHVWLIQIIINNNGQVVYTEWWWWYMKIGLVVMYQHVRTHCILRTIAYREKRHIAQKERCMEKSCSFFFF